VLFDETFDLEEGGEEFPFFLYLSESNKRREYEKMEERRVME
jgi:hypothetical protein